MSDTMLTVEAMVKFWRELEQRAPLPINWTIVIPYGTYRDLWNIQSPMRKKLARLARMMRQR